ncbi:MAG: hypothetical protein EA422_09875 [Gemmatimonadales bacterium]|nr:MAG: hypothetical protein EA422_09875 [Gemmatimonadales bacterium]
MHRPLRPTAPLIRSAATAWAAVILFLVPGVILANGGTLRVANAVMGDYRVSVFTDPTPVRPDSLDVSVLILQQGVEGVPDGVEVVVRTQLLELRSPEEAPAGARVGMGDTLRATREQADDPRYYAAKFGLGAEGLWEISVRVRGEAGEGEAAFQVTARERGLLGHPLTIIFLALLPLVGAAWWLTRDDGGGEVESPR